jgi:hypothetical protein
MAGTIVLLTVRRPRSNIQGVAALLPDFEAN